METYYDLLQRDEWKLKRLEILERDNNKCSECDNHNLLNEFRISYITTGQYSSGKAVIAVYDTKSTNIERCVTEFQKSYFDTLYKSNDEKSLICLTFGEGAFCKLMAMIFTNEQLNIYPKESDLNGLRAFAINHQKKQENFLRSLSKDEFKKLKWVNVKTLHIHHKYYWLSKMPWEYPNDALQTLCWKCHENLHDNHSVPVYDSNFNLIDSYQTCPRCSGAGYIPQYSHVQHGICFQCNGNRFRS